MSYYLRMPRSDAAGWDQDGETWIYTGRIGTWLYNKPLDSWLFVDDVPISPQIAFHRPRCVIESSSRTEWVKLRHGRLALWLDLLRLKRLADWLFNRRFGRDLENAEPPRIWSEM